MMNTQLSHTNAQHQLDGGQACLEATPTNWRDAGLAAFPTSVRYLEPVSVKRSINPGTRSGFVGVNL